LTRCRRALALVLTGSLLAVPALAGKSDWKRIVKADKQGDCAAVIQAAPSAFGDVGTEGKRLKAIEAVACCVRSELPRADEDALAPLVGAARHALSAAPEDELPEVRATLRRALVTRIQTLTVQGSAPTLDLALLDAAVDVAPDSVDLRFLHLAALSQAQRWDRIDQVLRWLLDAWEQIPTAETATRNALLGNAAYAVAVGSDAPDAPALLEQAQALAEQTGHAETLHMVRGSRVAGLQSRGLDPTPVLEQMLQADPDDPAVRLLYAETVQSTDAERGLELLKALLQDHPDNLRARFSLAAAHIDLALVAAKARQDLSMDDPAFDDWTQVMRTHQQAAYPHFVAVVEGETDASLRQEAVRQLLSLSMTLERTQDYQRWKALREGGR